MDGTTFMYEDRVPRQKLDNPSLWYICLHKDSMFTLCAGSRGYLTQLSMR